MRDLIYKKYNDPCIIEYINNIENLKRPRGNPGGKKRIYKNIICAFDIETTTIKYNKKDINFMYSWAFQFDEDITVIGRTWEEFYKFKEILKNELKGVSLCVFVHNLKYEFQYLKPLNFGPDDVIASDKREVIKAYSEPFEFRCSYRLTNLSLEKLTENGKYKKQGDFNYNKIRYPWTPLNDKELKYIIYDVLSLVEAIKTRNKIYNDNILSMPITATGYIRRIIKKNFRTYPFKKKEKQKITEKSYKFLAGSMRGGTAGANKYILGDTIENVYYYDRSSAYTSDMLFEKYPVKDWQPINNLDFENIIHYIFELKRAVIGRYIFKNLKLKDISTPCPYLGISKVLINGKSETPYNRIKSAEYIDLYLTDIDLKIVLKQYDFDSVCCVEAIKNTYGYLPDELTEPIFGMYKRKTELKGVDDVLYSVNKELQNSIFGLTAQNPAKEKIIYLNGEFKIAQNGIAANLKEFNKSATTPYTWGVYTSAHCRASIQKFIDIVGDDFIYCDTDGIYFINYDKHKKKIENLVKQSEKKAIKYNKTAIDNDGVIHHLGAWEFQGRYDKFKTLGVKKYVTETGGDINITIAGVNKKLGKKEIKNMEVFREGYTFKNAGGNEAIYIDKPKMDFIIINKKKIEITPYVVIRPKEFTLGKYGVYKKNLLYMKTAISLAENRDHYDNELLFGGKK